MISGLIVSSLLLATTQKPVEIPFTMTDNAMIVDAVVNGKKVSCMFDTGFSGSFVLGDNLNIGTPTGVMNLRDFVGQFQAKTVKIKTLALGPNGEQKVDVADMEVVQQPARDYTASYGLHCDGIMGLEVVAHNIVEINFQRKVMIFHPKTTDITKRTPDNQKTWLAKMLPQGNKSIELLVKTDKGENMILALDTGNGFYATTHRDVLERVGIWKEGKNPTFMKTSLVASGPVASWYLRMKDLNIYGVPVKESVWSIIDLPASSAEHDGTVGFGFLKHFNITIDLERRRVWLENFSGKVTDQEKAGTGISAFYDEQTKRMRIFNVTPGSPADKAGVKRGDHLLSVADKDLVRVGFLEVEELMEGPQGSKVKIALSRDGSLMRYELTREYLINEP